MPPVVVRVARLEVDPEQLEAFVEAVREEIEEAVRVESGVLAIHAVAEQEHPSSLLFFEIYADHDAYAAHRASPHFRKYLATTSAMVRSRELLEMVPIQLSSKA